MGVSHYLCIFDSNRLCLRLRLLLLLRAGCRRFPVSSDNVELIALRSGDMVSERNDGR